MMMMMFVYLVGVRLILLIFQKNNNFYLKNIKLMILIDFK
jgi:hypothetical protein